MQASTLLSAVTSTQTVTLTGAGDYEYHQIGASAVGGGWTVQVQWSIDETTWYDAAELLTLASGESGTVYVGPAYCRYLRAVCTRTAGALTLAYARFDAILGD